MLYNIAVALLRPIFFLFYNYRVTGKENIPEKGPYIVCANHVSAIDPIFIGIILPHQMHFMAKVELFKNWFIGGLLKMLGAFPIKRGEADLRSIKTSLRLLGDGKVLSLFPEGTRNKTNEIIAEPGIAMLSIKAKVPVLPIAIMSNYKFFNRTNIIIGKPLDLSEYYDKKLGSEEYTRISLGIMNNISELKKDENNENNT